MFRLACSFALLLVHCSCMPLWAEEEAAPLSALARLPVKEVTVFKDGHAFVLHEGKMPTDAAGDVLMDHLPTPIIGTFWPYATDKNAKLAMVTAGRRVVSVERTALTLRELLEANTGAEIMVTETGNTNPYPATLVGFLNRDAKEVAATAPPGSGDPLAQKGNLVLLKVADGTKVLAIEQIKDVKFLGKYKTTLANEEYRNLLTLKMDWAGAKPDKTASVGMVYLQKGVRWIPGYQVDLDGKGKAVVKLQATILNELTDLDNVTLNLVVGVPTFAFKDTIDPIALNQAIAQLSPYFDQHAQTAHAFSNAIMTQTARMGERVQNNVPAPAAPDLGPDVAGSAKSEDLYVYTVKGVTLKKGQRLVLPVMQETLEYQDIFTLDLPFSPPAEYRRQINDAQQAEIAKLFHAPKMMHKIRLGNKSQQPLTTAPALIVKNNKVLAQGMMTYTAAGAATDLTITTAVDIKTKKTEKETKRTPNAATLNGDQYWRIDLAGKIDLTNFRAQPVDVEVTRQVLGNVGEANEGGKAEMVNMLDEDGAPYPYPYWWGYYSWPAWWNHFNGMGKITWKLKLEPGKSVALDYDWHYFWR